MSEYRKINIQIAGRSYPLNVLHHEEEALRRVGKNIDAMIKDFEANFAVHDKQDALAMCVLRIGAEAEKRKNEEDEKFDRINKKLAFFGQILDDTEN